MNKRQIEKRISLIPQVSPHEGYIQDFEYLYLLKKTEKIIIATYILSDFVPQEERLKKSLKDNSHEILNSVCDLMNKRTDRLSSVQKVKSGFIKLTTQYSLAEISGFISRMNSQILKDEISLTIKMVSDLERELKDEQMPDLKQNDFSVDVRSKRQYNKPSLERMSFKGQGKGHIIKDSIGVPDTINKAVLTTDFDTNPSLDRDKKVIKIIKDKGIVSIKDISNQILDCSEKTIQRTLNKLITEGKIKKKVKKGGPDTFLFNIFHTPKISKKT